MTSFAQILLYALIFTTWWFFIGISIYFFILKHSSLIVHTDRLTMTSPILLKLKMINGCEEKIQFLKKVLLPCPVTTFFSAELRRQHFKRLLSKVTCQPSLVLTMVYPVTCRVRWLAVTYWAFTMFLAHCVGSLIPGRLQQCSYCPHCPGERIKV